MRNLWIMGGAVLAIGLVAGCQTKNACAKDEFEKFKKDRPAAEVVVSGDKAVDAVAVTTAKLYQQTNKLLDEYVAATDNHQEFFEFSAIVQAKMDNDKSLTMEAAREAAKADMIAADANVWPKIKAGYDATEALKPTNKLTEIAPLLMETAKTTQQAVGLKDSFKGFDGTTLAKVSSISKIVKQLDFNKDALIFLQKQYTAVNNAKKYMQ